MYIVNRHKHSSVEKKSDSLLVRSSLSDSHHEMVVELNVSIGLFKIEKVKAQIIRAPFELCFQELKDMQKLVGLTVQPGIFQEAKKIIGGPKGCAHLLDLMMEAVKTVIQSGFRLEGRQMSTEEKQKMYSDFFGMELKETCHVYDKLL